MPISLLVLLVVLAVAGGFYIGHRAGRPRAVEEERRPPKSLSARAREAATQGALGLWRWNRERKKKNKASGRRDA